MIVAKALLEQQQQHSASNDVGGATEPARAQLSKAHCEQMLRKLGFTLDELSLAELFDELDADDDGRLSEEELLTCIGMIKCNMLEIMHLEKSFVSFRNRASGRPLASNDQQEGVIDHAVYANDLVSALGVTEEEAAEMIFIADLKDNQRIDFTEFRQVVVNWSGCRV